MLSNAYQDGIFAAGEAEQRVKSLRAHLRQAAELEAAGNRDQARLEVRKSDRIIEELIRRLAGRFRRYARRRLPDPDLEEDAVVEMGIELTRRVRRIDGSYLFLEQCFNRGVFTMHLDVLERVRRENDLRPGQAAVLSLDARVADAEDAPLLADVVEDPAAREKLEAVLGRSYMECVMRELPPRHLQILIDRLNGLEWEQIAARSGVSLRTARNHYDQGLARVRVMLVSGAE